MGRAGMRESPGSLVRNMVQLALQEEILKMVNKDRVDVAIRHHESFHNRQVAGNILDQAKNGRHPKAERAEGRKRDGIRRYR